MQFGELNTSGSQLYRANGFDCLQFKRILQDPCEALPSLSVSQGVACALVQHFAWHFFWYNHLCEELCRLRPSADTWLSSLEDLGGTIKRLARLKTNVSAYVFIDVVEGLGYLIQKELGALLNLFKSYYDSLSQRSARPSSNIQNYIITGVNVSRRIIEDTIPLDLERIIHYHEGRTKLGDADSGFFEMNDSVSVASERFSALSEECSSLFSNIELATSGNSTTDRQTTFSVRPPAHTAISKCGRSWWLEPEGTGHLPRRRLYYDDHEEDIAGRSNSAVLEPQTSSPIKSVSTEATMSEISSRDLSAQQLRDGLYSWIENSGHSLSGLSQVSTLYPPSMPLAPSLVETA